MWDKSGFDSDKLYIGGIYELETINRETTALHYIYGPSGLVAIKKQEMEGNTTSLQFVLNDHLGSIQLLTDEQGNLIEEYSYDAWGMRRDPYTFELSLTGSSEIAYGFTGHEQLDLFKLVNMNGRMYDPVVGRFLSPDPVLQFPNFTQGLNPYSYALNNPLRFTDPSGYSLIGQMAALTASILFSGGNPIVAAGIYAAFMTMDHIIESGRSLSAGQFLGYFTQTFTLSVVSAGGSQAIGNMLEGVGKLGRELLRASAHGVFNGTMRLAQGGKFEHGFLSGFVSSLGGSFIVSYGGNMTFAEKTVISATIGGTAEALGGGKFANGAVTGAYVMMLNHLGDHGKSKKPSYLYNEAFSKGLAVMLKYTQNFGGFANPFFMADAIFVDGGVGFVGAEYDKGWFFVLSGDEAGEVVPYTEHGGGAAPEASIGGELGRVDLVDKSIPFKTEMLFGERTKTWGGAVFVGGSVSYSTYSGIDLISTSINIGLSANPFGGFSAGWNRGKIEP